LGNRLIVQPFQAGGVGLALEGQPQFAEFGGGLFSEGADEAGAGRHPGVDLGRCEMVLEHD
jgi:hypothetical protein